MINIKINNIYYRLPTLESELSTQQKKIIKKYSSIKYQPTSKTLHKLLTLLTGVEQKTVQNIDSESLNIFWNEYIHPLSKQIDPQKTIKTFIWNGIQINFPSWGIDLNGNNIPLTNISAKQFCEASDLLILNENRYKYLICAILCFPQNDTFDEQRIIKIADEFKDMPKHIISRIIAELKLALRYMKTFYINAYPQSMSWSDLLFISANYLPSEIDTIGRMNCYEFIKLAECRTKFNH